MLPSISFVRRTFFANRFLATARNSSCRIRAAALCLALAFGAATVSAQTRVYVDRDVGASGNGTSWAQAYKTIGESLTPNPSGGVDIWVAEGTYFESIALTTHGIALYGGFAGNETEVSQRDPATHVTTINASTADAGGPADHVVQIVLPGTPRFSNVRLDGFTVTGGVSNGTGGDKNGAGIIAYALDDTCVIANCTITGNSALASGSGGAMYCWQSTMTLSNCTISNNTAEYAAGGIWFSGGSPLVKNCQFTANSCGMYNGAIENYMGGLRLVNCTIANNSSGYQDGGVTYYDSGNKGEIVNCVFFNNRSPFGNGGVGFSAPTNPVTARMVNCLIYGGVGPAVWCWNGSPAIANCTIVNNSASAGGGLYATYNSDPVIRNTIFAGNSVLAVYEDASDADPTVVNCLFRDNAFGDFYDRETGTRTGAGPINSIAGCSGNVDGDPVFYSSTDFHLGSGSAAIDTGTAVGAPSFDFYSLRRPFDIEGAGADGTGTEFDIGVYEMPSTETMVLGTWILFE